MGRLLVCSRVLVDLGRLTRLVDIVGFFFFRIFSVVLPLSEMAPDQDADLEELVSPQTK